jgi:hypothetical protein
MGLGDKIKRTLREWGEETADVLTLPLEKAFAWGVNRLLDNWEPDLVDMVKPTLEELKANPDIPAEVKALVDKTASGTKAAPAAILIGLAVAIASGFIMASFSGLLNVARYSANKKLRPSRLGYEESAAALFRGVADEAWFQDNVATLGFKDEDIARIKAALHEIPMDQDLRAAYLREEIDEAKYQEKLRARGYSQEDVDFLRKLAWLLPNVQDLIHMAVREVFTPEIAAKYGQFEDFPADFVKWAKKIGLNEEWAKNYWAAHWILPSATQGFEMFHRDVITEAELKVLLRALDVMPFWRDKLIQIAYTPYTRVDVRRMHKLGILDRTAVKRSYLDLGYNEERAENMTRFTEEYNADPEDAEKTSEDKTKEKNRDLTTAQVTSGYHKGLFSKDEARAALQTLGYNQDEADFYLAMEDLKREQERKDEYISNFRQLFVTGIVDKSQVRRDLSGLNFPDAEVDQLLELWDLERLRRVERPTRADLDRFFKSGIINAGTYESEMKGLGYSDQYISWYLGYLQKE